MTWSEPRNTGPDNHRLSDTVPEDRDNRLQRSLATDPAWCTWAHGDTSRSAKITTILSDPTDTNTAVHLEPRTQYEVQVRALNGEEDLTFATATNWSTSGRGTTGASNLRPTFGSHGAVSPGGGRGHAVGDRTSAAQSRPQTRTATG